MTDKDSQILNTGNSITWWLTALFMLVMMIVAVGGYVRLSGSGLSIPTWPDIMGRYIPPTSDAGWADLRQAFDDDQRRLKAERSAGTIGQGSLGKDPTSMASFKVMVYTEWTHRILGKIIGVVALACFVVSLRHKNLRKRISPLIGSIVGLVIFQGVLGGVLVKSGTSTQYLFLHLGTAAVILGLIIWSMLKMLRSHDDKVKGRKKENGMMHAVLVISLLQIVLGALVAGSRGDGAVVASWPFMTGVGWSMMWDSHLSLASNLLDNSLMHQFVHRWFAWITIFSFLAAFIMIRPKMGARGRAAMSLSLGLLITQGILGVMSVSEGAMNPPLALVHLVTGMLYFATLVVAAHDMMYEDKDDIEHHPEAEGVHA